MIPSIDHLPNNKKLYFASDFHLGVPNKESSLAREKKVVRWLNEIEDTAQAIFLLGDIFDFWFEYKQVIPKGFVRIQGKLAELSDKGIPIVFFTGNHDMWMFDYFPNEFNIPVYRDIQTFSVNGKKFYIGHGDGLGPGDRTYKILKKIFANKLCQWVFARLHPNLGIGIANLWSKKSRIASNEKEAMGGGCKHEWLHIYCKEIEAKEHYDYYVFGHRHLPLNLVVAANSRYFNLGEWVNHYTYGVFDGKEFKLETFEK